MESLIFIKKLRSFVSKKLSEIDKITAVLQLKKIVYVPPVEICCELLKSIIFKFGRSFEVFYLLQLTCQIEKLSSYFF
jgi:hypothetical protein